MNKIVYRDGRIPSIFFPAGKVEDGGTCEFSTKKCRERCPSDCNSNEIEKQVYETFKTSPANKIAEQIHMDLLDMNFLFLHWFAWGDCPSDMIEKISWIIRQLKEQKIIQCGFTRNELLWRKVRSITKIAFTVEKKTQIKKHCEYGVVAWPDYEKGVTRLYRGMTQKRKTIRVGSCTGTWLETEDIGNPYPRTVEAQCDICHEKEIGCFVKGKE